MTPIKPLEFTRLEPYSGNLFVSFHRPDPGRYHITVTYSLNRVIHFFRFSGNDVKGILDVALPMVTGRSDEAKKHLGPLVEQAVTSAKFSLGNRRFYVVVTERTKGTLPSARTPGQESR